ncbi:MAG TPA: RNA polymerase sigma-54 factor [Desulfobacterales bacterium]|nr:RNA polymerase sigma-54 factor [Desulfobacterales bacterium]
MALELRQQVKLTQQLVMTPQLQQAIKLLQLSRLELAETIQQEMEHNPVLEEAPEEEGGGAAEEPEVRPDPETTPAVSMEDGGGESSMREIDWTDYANEYESLPSIRPGDDSEFPSRLNILTRKPDLASHLQWQLSLSDLSDEEKEVGEFIIGNLDKDGFLDIDTPEIAAATGCDEETAARLVRVVQEMDPAGIGARNVQESLLLQLERLGLGDSLAAVIVRDHLRLLERKNYAGIVRATKASRREVLAAIDVITGLDPHPGRQYSDEEPHYIVPDVYVYKMDDEYVILLNEDGLPRLRISGYYRKILQERERADASTREYITEKLRSAQWLIKSIHQRQRTIYRVVESIVKFQKPFFEHGIAHLRPLVLRDIAEDIGMHESTISRVTSNKYVHTPQGTFELKFFFNSAIERRDGGEALASLSIKERIRRIIQEEDPEKPLSDSAIAAIFNREGIKLARRTVAKYREQMGILPSKLRKKPKLR